METLKQRLESGDDVDLLSESDLCTVASLLKRYLRDLPEGLVDSAVQQALIQHYKGKTCHPTSVSCALSTYLPARVILLGEGFFYYTHVIQEHNISGYVYPLKCSKCGS